MWLSSHGLLSNYIHGSSQEQKLSDGYLIQVRHIFLFTFQEHVEKFLDRLILDVFIMQSCLLHLWNGVKNPNGIFHL